MFNKNRFLRFNSSVSTVQLFAFLLALSAAGSALAREWRVGQIPNGSVNRCANCHVSAQGGGSRNAFGQDVEQRVSPFGSEEFWDATLAAIDSDGDTFSNGTELADPDGNGTPTPNPTPSNQVFNPGNASSRPASPQPPVVSITAPANNSTFNAPADVEITASASVVGSTITSVEFFNGATSLGADNASPYAVTATLQAGTHTLTARATAANGESATSSGITVTVNAPPSAPVIAITSPANNAVLNNASVTVTASATVQGSTIAMVEFFDGATMIGMVHEEPFTATATLSAGAHVLTAKATAANSETAVSAPVNITVQLGGTPINDPYPARMARTDTTIELQTIAEGMAAPLGLAAPNDGSNRLFLFDQTGLIYVITNGTRLEVPLLDMRSRLVALQPGYDERGLLGLAVHPSFAQNGLLYTYASYPTAGAATFPIAGQMDHQTVLAEWKIDPANMNLVDPASYREILRIDQPQFNHNGGVMHFGMDGFLYLALGDGGNRDDEGVGHSAQGNGQDLEKILGKLIRIDVNARTSGNGQYGVPSDNPFVGKEGLDEIYAYGFRNPYSWSVDKLTGELYVADVGQGKIEELDRVFKGGNYGWPIKEGTFFFTPGGPDVDGFITTTPSVASVPPDLIDPIAEYDHDEGLSIIGGYMYRGTAFPNLIGRYITGDFGLFSDPVGRLFVLDRNEFRELRIGTDDRALGHWIKGFGQDQQGELYVLVSTTLGPSGTTGKLLKLVPADYDISLTGIQRNDTNVTVNWSTTGVGPYALESKGSLEERAWRVVTASATGSSTVPMETKNGFMRIRDTAGIRDSAFTVHMTAAAERPPVTAPDAAGSGTLVIEGNTLHFDIRYSGLSGNATAAHIHGPASASESTNVLINLQPFNGGAFGQSGVLSGSITLTPAQKAMILSGKTYVNIHTGANPPGEIRGQVAPVLWMVDLSGENERPNPVDTTGRGSGILMLIGDKLTFDIEYSELKATASLAHIHGAGDVNISAPVMVDLNPYKGHAFGTNGTFTGTATLTPAQIAALVDGLTYVNVHTPAPFHPSGEIRGQIWPKSTAIPLTANLSGTAEHPEVTTPAMGAGTFALDGNTLHVNVTYRGLKDVANNMHIHGPAPASISTGVLVDLVPLHVGPFGTNGAIAGSVELTDAQRAAILEGRTYVNIHSRAHGGGEIRGQIIPSVMHSVLLGASERLTAVHGTGRGRGTLLLAHDQLSINATYNGLTGGATMAHIHGPATTSEANSVMIGLDALNAVVGNAGSFSGVVPLTVPQLSALVDALTYINVHTSAHGSGEIRGQIIR